MSYRDIFSRFINFHRAIRYLLCFFPPFSFEIPGFTPKKDEKIGESLGSIVIRFDQTRIRPRDIYGRLSIKFDELTFSALEYLSNAI